MKRILVSLLILVTAGFSETQELRSTVEQWVDVMEKIHTEKSRWNREKEVLLSSREGLQTEIIDLQERIQGLRLKETNAATADQEGIETKRKYDEAREVLGEGLDKLMTRVPALIALVPKSYLNDNPKLGAAKQSYETDLKNAEAGKDLGKKLNLIVSLLSELESFNQMVWTVAETHKVGGAERIVRTVYLGLGASYSADEKGQVALIGHPSSTGWTYKEIQDEGAASEINKLITTATGAGDIQFSTLPVEIK